MSLLHKNPVLSISIADLLVSWDFSVWENISDDGFDAYLDIPTVDGFLSNIHIRHPYSGAGFICTIHGPYGSRLKKNFPEGEFLRMMEWLESVVQKKIMD